MYLRRAAVAAICEKRLRLNLKKTKRHLLKKKTKNLMQNLMKWKKLLKKKNQRLSPKETQKKMM